MSFDDALMELQKNLVALCVEFAENPVEKIYGYMWIVDSTPMFRALYLANKTVYTVCDDYVNLFPDRINDLTRLAEGDIADFVSFCTENGFSYPSEIRMSYEVKSKSYIADINYEPKAMESANIEKLFIEWVDKQEFTKLGMKFK